MRFLVIACVVATALGFTASGRRVGSSTQLSAKSKSVPFLEVSPALAANPDMPGNVQFDPLGFTNNWLGKDWSQQVVPDIWPETAPRTPITTLEWMREAEVKHGRVSMLAIVGWVAVDAGVRLPGSVFAAIPDSLSAHNAAVANGSMGFLLLVSFVLELAGGAAIYDQAKGSGRKPAEFAFDPLGLAKDPVNKARYLQNEIKNGRLAMLAFSGIVTQNALHPDVAFPYF